MYFFSIVRHVQILIVISLFNSNFFKSLLVDGKTISFQLYCSIKGLTLGVLSGLLLILSRFNAKVTAY